jgi:hypothetical protein
VRLAWIAAVALTAAGHASAAQAQTRAGRIELAVGAGWIGAISLDRVAANETAPGGASRALFNSDTQLDGSVGAAFTVGMRLSSLLRAEAAVAFNPSHLTTRVTADAEGVPDLAVQSRVTQYIFGGDLLVQPSGWRRHRLAPFASVGAGYLRQLSDGRTLVQSGTAYFAGGGLYYERVPGRPRRVKATGIRLDLRALALRDGVAPDHKTRVTPAVTASVFARF